MLTSLRLSLRWIFLSIGIIVILVPFIWMITGSFRSEADLFGAPQSLFPTE